MRSLDLINKIISDIEIASSKGIQQFTTVSLKEYLLSIKKNLDNADEYQKIMHDFALKELEAQNQSNLAMFHSVMESGKEALRSSLIANGGAVVAILALLGNLELAAMEHIAAPISYALCVFSCATLCVLLSYACRYFAQLYYSRPETQKSAVLYHYSAIFICFLSYFLFVWGLISTHQAFIENF